MTFFIILGIVEVAVLIYIAIFSRAHFVKHFVGIVLVALIGAGFVTAGNGEAKATEYLEGAAFFAFIPALIIGIAERGAYKRTKDQKSSPIAQGQDEQRKN